MAASWWRGQRWTPTLTHEEKVGLFDAVVEAVGHRACVFAGTGNYNTAESIALTKAATDQGVRDHAHHALLQQAASGLPRAALCGVRGRDDPARHPLPGPQPDGNAARFRHHRPPRPSGGQTSLA